MLIWRSLSPKTIATLLRRRTEAASSASSAGRAAATGAGGANHDRRPDPGRTPQKSTG